MTRVYLIRHGETEANQSNIIQGWLDTALSERGRQQAEALSRRFMNIEVDAVYSSDLSRAIATAEGICRIKGLELNTDERLREVHMGAWSGCTWDSLVHSDPERTERFLELSPDWRAPEGESFEDLRTRVGTALLEIAKKHSDQTIVIVSHGTAIRHTLARFKGLTVQETKKEKLGANTSISILEFEGETLRIVSEYDISHLQDENAPISICP